ncbi:uncharacterized protein HaLaN_07016, partial [Haematococcus lacustris]
YRKQHRRFFYVTPTSYLQLLEGYSGLLLRKRQEVAAARRRYQTGLHKLAATEASVQGMQGELEALQPQLMASSQETEALMQVITHQTAEADKVKVVVQADEASAKLEAAKVKAIKDECEADLAQALPAFNAAIKALDTLTKNDISEDNIAPEVIEALQPLLKSNDFQPAKIKKVSQAAFGLCSWVRAMDTYNRVAKVVGPKRAKLGEAEVQLGVVMRALASKQAELAAVEAKLAELGTQLDAAKAKKDGLEAEVALCEEKLDRAHKLIGGLGGEKVRWTTAAAELGHLYDHLGQANKWIRAMEAQNKLVVLKPATDPNYLRTL